MNVQEFYTAIGGDYTEALSRLMNDALILRFVGKFAEDPNFAGLSRTIADGNWEEAFSFSHTLKGVALNLAFSRLSKACVALTDALRPQNRATLTPAAAETLFAAVQTEYARVTSALSELG